MSKEALATITEHARATSSDLDKFGVQGKAETRAGLTPDVFIENKFYKTEIKVNTFLSTDTEIPV